MTALIIDNLTRALIFDADLAARSRCNGVDTHEDKLVRIPLSYWATMAYEKQDDGTTVRHLKVWSDAVETPHCTVVGEIMAEFKFRHRREDTEGWIDRENGHTVVHLVEEVEEGWQPIPSIQPQPRVEHARM